MVFGMTRKDRPAQEFPPELDVDFYRRTQPDLRRLSDEDARMHFEVHGRGEGRPGSAAGSRPGFLALIDSKARILEIGPAHKPCFVGPGVAYFDVQDSGGLRARALQHNESPDGVPARIDFVSPTGDLSIVEGQFDFVFSSHAIEHQPDLIKHLSEVARLLRPGAAYFVICPDKRYTFDRYIPECTIGDVIEAHMSGRSVHKVADVIDQYILSCHNDPARHWAGDSPQEPMNLDHLKLAMDSLAAADGGYVDTHAWRLSAPGFRQMLDTLYRAGMSPLRLARLYDTPRGSNEFFAILVQE